MGLRIKKLEWEKEPDGRWVYSEAWRAEPLDATGYFIGYLEGQWSWRLTWEQMQSDPKYKGNSLDDCQRQCQEHWEQHVGQCLEEDE